ncbi:MAG: DUF2264 domain-containing protein [Bacteroidota bacterium]
MTPELKLDFKRSSYTGWTRETWVDLAEKMIAALQPWYTEGRGGLAFPRPYREVDASLVNDEQLRETFHHMEGWTRTRPLVAAWMVGTGRDKLVIGGKEVDIRQEFIDGFLSASDPKSPDYISERFGVAQWIAELSIAAYGLWIARDKVWNALSQAQKDQISTWLNSGFKHKIPDNNWNLFTVLTCYVLKDLGCEYDERVYVGNYNRANEFYLDEGWYVDGLLARGFSIEQYNAWMFHYYLPAFVQISKEEEPERKTRIIYRLRAFLEAYKDFFAKNGGFPMWGRSLFYKPGVLIPFVMAEILGCSPLTHGQSRRLVSGYMDYLVKNNYFDQDMLPIMGYLVENHGQLDSYSIKGSAYWGASAFLNLLLPAEHPFWTAPEEPLRVETESYVRNIKPVSLQVTGDHATGEVQMINHRAWHMNDRPATRYGVKYTKFCYSSHFGFDVKRPAEGYNCDCMIQVSPDGVKYSHRVVPNFIALGERSGASWHYPFSGAPSTSYPFAEYDESAKITTHTYLKGSCQLRAHLIETEKPLAAFREGGYAVDFDGPLPEVIAGPDYVAVWNGEKGAFIRNLYGFAAPMSREEILRDTARENIYKDQSATPALRGGRIEAGAKIVVSFSGTFFRREDLDGLVKLVKGASVEGKTVSVQFADGEKREIKF